MSRGWGYTLALLSAATGALRYNLAVFARGEGYPYEQFLALSLVVGVLCCSLHLFARDGFPGFVPLRGHVAGALLYGALMGWSTLSHFVALNHLNETVMTSLAQTNILMTIGLAVWLLGERFTLREWAATTVICAGVFLFRPWAAGNLTGFLILMSGLLCGSLATVGAKRWVERIPPPMLMLWRNGVALALVAVWCLGDETVRPSTAAALAAIGAGILGPYLHGLFFLQALERIEAAKASLTGRVQPVIVFLVSWIFLGKLPALGETLSAGLLVAGALLLVAARPRS